MAVQKNTQKKLTPVSTQATAKKSNAEAKRVQKPSTKDTLKKATVAKKSSAAKSTAKTKVSGKVSAVTSKITKKNTKSVTKTSKGKPESKEILLKKKSPAKKIVPSKKSIEKPTKVKKEKKKSTSELLKAIKARDVEIQQDNDTPKVASPKKERSPSKARAKKLNSLPIVPPMQKAFEIIAPSAIGKKLKNRASFNKKDLELFKQTLLTMRDHFIEQIDAMRHDALQRDDEVNSEEDGTDAFMRLQALNQMNAQQHAVADIDIALASIIKGDYGECEMCACLISTPRLLARPFAKFCIKCKSEMERSNRFQNPR